MHAEPPECSLNPLGPLGDGGRDPATGRFLPGNPGGKGNPRAKRVAELREAMMDAVTADDLRAIVRTLIRQARDGDVTAAREVLDRTCGRVSVPLAIELEADDVKLYGKDAPIDSV